MSTESIFSHLQQEILKLNQKLMDTENKLKSKLADFKSNNKTYIAEQCQIVLHEIEKTRAGMQILSDNLGDKNQVIDKFMQANQQKVAEFETIIHEKLQELNDIEKKFDDL